jgi:hypothetical protein
LVQAQNNRYLSSTTDICGNAYILSTTWVILSTWVKLNNTGLVSFNFPMDQFQKYVLVRGSWTLSQGGICNNRHNNASPDSYLWFTSSTWFFVDSPIMQWGSVWYYSTRGSSYVWIYQDITWSWIFYWPPVVPTIHYNWLTGSFAGTDLYLIGNFVWTTSGADYIYTAESYRVMFRYHP